MMKLSYRFVKNVPEEIENGIIYVSIEYATAIHKCCCGCGNEVVTPISPTDWELIFNGNSISLYPSIGNWSLKCKSHYWITRNRVEWASKWKERDIKYVQEKEKLEKDSHYRKRKWQNLFKSFYKE